MNAQKEKQTRKRTPKPPNPDREVKLGQSEWPMVQIRVRFDPDTCKVEKWPITALGISQRAENAALRVGLRTIGDVLDNWGNLLELKPKMIDPENHTAGQRIGMTSAVEIRRAVFSLLCSETRMTLGIDLTGVRHEYKPDTI